MENQGKRLLLAVTLALGVMLAWNMLFAPDKKEPAPGAGSGSAGAAPSQLVKPRSQVGVSTDPSAPPSTDSAVTGTDESRISLEFPGQFTATFGSSTGSLVSWKLADPRFDKDQTRGELLPGVPGTGAMRVDFARSTYVLPPGTRWEGTKVSPTEVRYTAKSERIEITKTFTVVPESFLVRLVIDAKVDVPAGRIADQALAVSVFSFQDPKKIVKAAGQGEDRAWFSSTYRGDKIYHTPISSLINGARFEDGFHWTGFEHPYLLAAYAPRLEAGARAEKRTFALEIPVGLMRTDITFPRVSLEPGARQIKGEVVAYLGPKNYDSLDSADQAAGYSTGFKETIDFGWFAFIGKPLLWLMLKFYGFLGSWGIAIILLTILVKLATLYWTTKSMRSMKAMAALAPQMRVLQDKYKGDTRRVQSETMALYARHKVSPVAGCLPMFLQMPVWIALYRMLSSAGELYQQAFIPGWIDDLTNTDPYHILPVVLLVTMFAQARLQPATGDSRQQKFLQYGMPLMFGVMAFFFPAGLTLYIFTNTVLGAMHSIYMNKYDKKTKAAVEAITKAADAPADGKAKVIDTVAAERKDDDSTTPAATSAPRPRNNTRSKKKKKSR